MLTCSLLSTALHSLSDLVFDESVILRLTTRTIEDVFLGVEATHKALSLIVLADAVRKPAICWLSCHEPLLCVLAESLCHRLTPSRRYFPFLLALPDPRI